MSVSCGRTIARYALGAAALAAIPSIASATVFTMDTTVTNGSVGIDTSVGSVVGTISAGGNTEIAQIGRIKLYGQASDKPNGTLTSLPVWCIDITDNLSSGKFVEKPLSFATTGGGADVTYSSTQLNNALKFLVYATGQGISTATTSAATQLGLWEILNETSMNPTWNLSSGNFKATQWSSGSSATTLANSWLTSSAFASTSTQNYSLAILDAGASNQMLAYLRYTAPVPEPTTWMTMIIGFGALGLAVRRRRAVGRAVA